MSAADINDFTKEVECLYKEERYYVRDNGAVLRIKKNGKRKRPNDNKWTFGKSSLSNAYLHIAGVRVHRIIATAFHGEPPNNQYVVDHIDTNCRNNRPENLKWVTRLENAINNPITRKKIELICGSIEEFLEDPSKLNIYKDMKSIAWMKTVTPEEAKNCRERMLSWARSKEKPIGGSFGNWVYKPMKKKRIFYKNSNQNTFLKELTRKIQYYELGITNDIKTDFQSKIIRNQNKKIGNFIGDGIIESLTDKCAQSNWRIPSYFPCCPEKLSSNPIDDYFNNLKIGVMFTYNNNYSESTVIQFTKTNYNSSILVMCEKESLKPWSIAEITFENGLFVHSNLGSYFDKSGANKIFCIKQGLEWKGEDSIDDFC